MASIENHLIELLPKKDRTRLVLASESIELGFGEVLSEVGKPMHHVYFPITGFISLVTVLDEKPVLEVGMVGREGMLGAHLALGVMATPLHALVQGAGAARRMGRAAFIEELKASAALRITIDRYLYVLMGQLASSAACLRFHLIEHRLARWLLMSQDRAHADSFHATHEFLAFMLGVRRVGVTAAASELQRQGLIEYHRGAMTVVDRKGLEQAACGCYSLNRGTYRAVLGPLPAS